MAGVRAPRLSVIGLALLALVAAPALGGGLPRHTAEAGVTDPPLLVPWSRIGDIALGESRERVERVYGSKRDPLGFYRIHGGKVWVSYDRRRVADIGFTTPYYRTKSGFGVGSKVPLGPCHRTGKTRCEHRWHGFVWNAWAREKPCSCWVKVGLGPRSLPATVKNFLKPWFFIYMRGGRVTRFYFALKFVD